MSYIFEIGTETVWSPSLRTGQIYIGYLKALEEASGTSAGLTPISSDMTRIELEQFGRFVQELAAEHASAERNIVLREALGAVLGPSVVMLERGGAATGISASPELAARWRDLSKVMPR